MVRLSLAAGLAGLAGVSGFAPQVPQRPTTVLQYKKTAKEMRAKYPEGGKVPYVLSCLGAAAGTWLWAAAHWAASGAPASARSTFLSKST